MLLLFFKVLFFRNFDLQPNNPAYGDVHFYNEFINLWAVDKLMVPRCATEFGVFSFPLRSTMLNYIPESDWHYSSRLINLRDHHPGGVITMLIMMSEHFSLPMKDWILNMDGVAYVREI